MSDILEHPFKPGVRVVIKRHTGYRDSPIYYRESTVDKVRKDGRFTVNGLDGQWTPSTMHRPRWTAYRRGDQNTVYLRDKAMEQELLAARATRIRETKFYDALKALNEVRRNRITDQLAAALENAVLAITVSDSETEGEI